MRDNDQLFNQLGGSFFRYLIDSTDDKNKGAQTRLMLVAIGLLAFVGVEAVKVVFRKNFGTNGISILKLVIASIAFGLISFAAFGIYGSESIEDSEFGSQDSFLYMAIFYAFFTIYILFKGVTEKGRANNNVHENYRGDSSILGFLIKEGWTQAKVQNLAEPLFTLALGVFLMAINIFWGLPLIFCAISVWLNLLIESFLGLDKVRDTLSNMGYNRNNNFSEVQ